jgi:hypothetical protein
VSSRCVVTDPRRLSALRRLPRLSANGTRTSATGRVTGNFSKSDEGALTIGDPEPS